MEQVPASFKWFNRVVIGLYRLGFGALLSGPRMGYIMVLTTIGRKSGQKRRTPVNYAWDGTSSVYCLAGRGHRSDWYRNLLAKPYAEVWIDGDWWTATAREVTDPDEWLDAYRRVLIASGFAAERYLDINPREASDDELRAHGEGTPVMRVKLESALYGSGGPGGLRWVWQLGLALAVIGLLFGQRGTRHVR